MTKYKIVGIVNLLLGFFEVVYPLLVIVFTIPKLIELYSKLEAKGPNLTITYIILVIVILMGIGNFFLGIKLFSKSKDKYFTYAVILIVTSILLGGIFTSITSLSLLMPIYSLTSQV